MRRTDLDGAVVVLTRRAEDNAALASRLRARGADVIELPCVRTAPVDPDALRAEVATLGPEDLLVLTSRVAADAVAEVMGPTGLACGVAAVGNATAERAAALGLRVLFVASLADGGTLGRELPIPHGEVVLARSDLADPVLPAWLRARGARVREVVAYRTIAELRGDAGVILHAVDRGPVTVVVASPSAVDALTVALDPATLRRVAFVATGPRTARRVNERIGTTATTARTPDDASIDEAIRATDRVAS